MFSSMRPVVLSMALIVSLGLNVATVTVQSIAMAVSSTVSAVAGVSAVLPQFQVVEENGERKFLIDVAEGCGLQVPTKEEIWETVKESPGAAWELAKEAMPEVPELPELTLPEMPELTLPDMPAVRLPEMPEGDWKFWQ